MHSIDVLIWYHWGGLSRDHGICTQLLERPGNVNKIFLLPAMMIDLMQRQLLRSIAPRCPPSTREQSTRLEMGS